MPKLACREKSRANYEYTPNTSGETRTTTTYACQSNKDEDTDVEFRHCLLGVFVFV